MNGVLVKRLQKKGLSRAVAAKLVLAGFSTPRAIKAATDSQLRAIEGIGYATVTEIRQKVG